MNVTRLPAVARALLLGILVGLISAQPVLGSHLLPNPRWWWDLNDNRLSDATDSIIGFGSAGVNWTQEKHNDVVSAVAAWSSGTDYNPFDATGGGTIRGTIRVDTTEPWCISNYVPGIVGVTCRRGTPISEGGTISFYDITDMDIGINSEDYQWNYGSDDPAGNQWDFRGVLTHELGHTARLVDVYYPNCGNPIYTMCGEGTLGSFTKQLRTLTSHDVTDVNTLYP